MLDLGNAFGGKAAETLAALDRSLATIEFDPTGTILTANANFCRAMGYERSEIIGKHHSLFVDADYRQSQDYRDFWARLARGEFEQRDFLRIGKGGTEVWIQAAYTPVRNAAGKVTRVVKVASVITEQKQRAAENDAKLAAIGRVQAVIEFTPQGLVLDANDNFLQALGYTLSEIKGQHHRMFVAPEDARSADYDAFWKKLNAGEFVAAEFKRIGKGGRTVWIQASYNPVFDARGRVAKVVKFATVITGRVEAVEQLADALESLAANDLAYRMDRPIDPQFQKVRDDFNAAISALDETMGGVASVIQSVGAGADEISRASDDLSRRTEQQAASLEETAAALDEITSTVNRSAEGAKQAAGAASEARVDAAKSGEIVSGAVTAMDEIETGSSQINQIIGVIDEIAFQTNLLALNAGVEAARAGEAGRGFAVVAQEVRALAQRSADAAKEIKVLIANSSAQVERGVKLVGETGRALSGIVSKVSQIDSLITEIAQSSREQATGLNEVNVAVNQMDQVTQQNAAMVEETTAASANLQTEAAELRQMIA
ncbi:PAS domain-containing methyl-accepting chemotaxis protein, partial [Caulobacter sp. HMWF009]